MFLVELALLAVLAVAGARLGDGAPAFGLGVGLPLAAAVLWGLWLLIASSALITAGELRER